MSFYDIFGQLIDHCDFCGELKPITDIKLWSCGTCKEELERDAEEVYEEQQRGYNRGIGV